MATQKKAQRKGPWTLSEERYVRENYQGMTDKEMAAFLKRGVGGVTWKRTQMGLSKEATSAELQRENAEYRSFFTKLRDFFRG